MILQNMQGIFFMQLLIILALLLFGGKSSQNMLEEVKPVLENLVGGEEIKEVLKSAEEISSVLSAVSGLASGAGGFAQNPPQPQYAQNSPIAFPLKPISAIADRDISYSLSRYISEN